MTKFKSITTPEIEHDDANMLVEFIWLNRNLACGPYPWREANGKEWGRLVAVFKKLMKFPYDLTSEQLAFYIYKCKPLHISSEEFAKMAVVARKLFQKYKLNEVSQLYQDKRAPLLKGGLEMAPYRQEKPISLLSFLRELENGETAEKRIDSEN
jgi:hypothetical protein